MSVEQLAIDGILNRVVTRVKQETPKIDAATVERALAVRQAEQARRLMASGISEVDQTKGETRVVSRQVSGKEEAIAIEERWPYAGLAPMTRVRTSFGDVYAVALRKGDLVKTRNGSFKPIVWLDRIMLDDKFLETMRDANPISLPAGSVARGLPKADVQLSPRQVIADQSDFMEAREAADLIGRPNIRRKFETGLSYTIFHLGRTEQVNCEGLWVTMEV